ncbi:hypothetical protein [Cupriavidus sp. DF5525]|uniref:hypothetical protein n=1 Tax=Cupriavidus sp. DF5525 TaxID=3160989 RepID=UPI0032DFFC8F
MARIRTIKPDFWTDEKIVELPFEARLFFIGTWNFADDNGNLQRSARKLKMQIFPADSIDCEPVIGRLLSLGLLSEYSVNGDTFLHIEGFERHQVINRKSKSAIPVPAQLTENKASEAGDSLNAGDASHPDSVNGGGTGADDSGRSHGGLTEDSVSDHGAITEGSLTEGKGREGNRKGKDSGSSIVSGSRATGGVTIPNPPTSEGHWASHFRERHGVEIDVCSIHDRKKAWPIFAGWVNAGLTLDRVDAAVTQARKESKEPIAFLPAYVDRVLASQAPSSTTGDARAQERADVHATLTGRRSSHERTPETFDVDARVVG